MTTAAMMVAKDILGKRSGMQRYSNLKSWRLQIKDSLYIPSEVLT